MNKKEKLAIIILGAPGSGKGVQGKRLEEDTGFKRYVMSDLIRNSIKEQNDIAEKMKNGQLLSDIDIFEVFKNAFKNENNIILDGIPRSTNQAYWLYGLLTKNNYNINVVYFDISEQKLMERILKRGRVDDNAQVFKYRLEQYNISKKAVLDVFDDKITYIDADRTPNEVTEDIIVKLKLK